MSENDEVVDATHAWSVRVYNADSGGFDDVIRVRRIPRGAGDKPYHQPPGVEYEDVFSVDATDKEVMSDLAKTVSGYFPGRSDLARKMTKLIRGANERRKEKSWRDVLPPEIVKWALNRLAEDSSGEQCVDNYRVARTGSSPQKRRYRRAKMSGCCGSHDFTAQGPDGKTYMLGYNYGH